MVSTLTKLNLWWRNAHVLHFLTCYLLLSVIALLFEIGLPLAISISVLLGVGKELIDKYVFKTKFETIKSIVTAIGGITFYLLWSLTK